MPTIEVTEYTARDLDALAEMIRNRTSDRMMKPAEEIPLLSRDEVINWIMGFASGGDKQIEEIVFKGLRKRGI